MILIDFKSQISFPFMLRSQSQESEILPLLRNPAPNAIFDSRVLFKFSVC